MTLTEFLLARIAEDEALSRPYQCKRAWVAYGGPVDDGPTTVPAITRRLDPARVLAECEAKRRIVGEHGGGFVCESCAGEPRIAYKAVVPLPTAKRAPCPTLRALGVVYADHPDYQPEWRP